MKWLLTIVATVAVVGVCLPRLARWLRIGRLPGDVTVRWRGRDLYFPFATTALLSLLASLLFRLL